MLLFAYKKLGTQTLCCIWMSDSPTGIAPKVWYETVPDCAVFHIYANGTILG